MFMSATVESPTNKVIREYAITPSRVNGHKVADEFIVQLRYTEAESIELRRDSEEALGEAIECGRRRGKLPKGATASAVCVLESLRRA